MDDMFGYDNIGDYIAEKEMSRGVGDDFVNRFGFRFRNADARIRGFYDVARECFLDCVDISRGVAESQPLSDVPEVIALCNMLARAVHAEFKSEIEVSNNRCDELMREIFDRIMTGATGVNGEAGNSGIPDPRHIRPAMTRCFERYVNSLPQFIKYEIVRLRVMGNDAEAAALEMKLTVLKANESQGDVKK